MRWGWGRTKIRYEHDDNADNDCECCKQWQYFLLFYAVVEKPVMVRDLAYTVRHEICQMLNVIRTLGGDFKTLAGSLGRTTQEIRLISDQNDPADEVLMWWETQNSATVQNLRLQLKTWDVTMLSNYLKKIKN